MDEKKATLRDLLPSDEYARGSLIAGLAMAFGFGMCMLNAALFG